MHYSATQPCKALGLGARSYNLRVNNTLVREAPRYTPRIYLERSTREAWQQKTGYRDASQHPNVANSQNEQSKTWQQKNKYREAPRHTHAVVSQQVQREAWQQKNRHREAPWYKPLLHTTQVKAAQTTSAQNLKRLAYSMPAVAPGLAYDNSSEQRLSEHRLFQNAQSYLENNMASSHGIFHLINMQTREQRLSLTWREPSSLPKPLCSKKVEQFKFDFPRYESLLKKEKSDINGNKVIIYKGNNSCIQKLKCCFQNLDLQIPLRVTNDYSEVDPKLTLYLSGLRGEIKDLLETVIS